MLSINLVCIGKLKERYWQEACEEYQKRLSSVCRLSVLELPEYRLPQNPSDAQIRKGIEQEGAAIRAKSSGGFRFAMCIEGKTLSSEQLAQKLNALALSGTSEISFLIGGSFGLSDHVKSESQLRFSMSPMTFPHQMARVMLLEQLYRAFSINTNGKYHK